MEFLLKLVILIPILLTWTHVGSIQCAPIICETATSSFTEKSFNQTGQPHTQDNEINKFLHKIQCTLEKAKPWMDELQQEAKRLEDAAKLLGLGILHSFGEFIDKLAEEDDAASMVTSESDLFANATTETATTLLISQYLCPEGFVADHNGICERFNSVD